MRPQNRVKPDPAGLAETARAASSGSLPPIERWDPPYCGEIDMVIARDGTWFYQATPIGRPSLVRLFSTILWREDDAYFLITPAEKVRIGVEDAPFVAVDVSQDEDGLRFTTNVGDQVLADADHPIRVVRDPETGEPSPYICVRRNLEALIDRKSFYRLVEMMEAREHEGVEWVGLVSRNTFFPVAPAAEIF